MVTSKFPCPVGENSRPDVLSSRTNRTSLPASRVSIICVNSLSEIMRVAPVIRVCVHLSPFFLASVVPGQVSAFTGCRNPGELS